MHSLIALDWIAIGFLVVATLQISNSVRLIAKALGLAETLHKLAIIRELEHKRLSATDGTDGTP